MSVHKYIYLVSNTADIAFQSMQSKLIELFAVLPSADHDHQYGSRNIRSHCSFSLQPIQS